MSTVLTSRNATQFYLGETEISQKQTMKMVFLAYFVML